MEIPVEILERLSHRPKRVAEPGVNLEQLRRVEQSTRREWWQEMKACQAEYDALPYDRDEFLESNIALARLKLVVSFLDNGETAPPDHGFSQGEIELLREFEKFIVYDRLSLADIKDYVRSGREDEKGIVKLARDAAVSGYDQMYRLMEERNIPNDLAFALQRVYQERIRKIEAAAAELRLSEVYQDIERAKATAGEVLREVYKEVEVTKEAAEERASPDIVGTRRLEQAYIAAVEAKLRDKTKGLNWTRIERFDSLKKIHSELKLISPDKVGMVRETMPHGLGLRAVIEERKLRVLVKPALLLVVRVLSDYKELYTTGADGKLSLGQAMSQIEESRFIGRGTACVLVLAATAGWEQKAIDYAKKSVLPSPGLSLALIDLRDKALHYNPEDERLRDVLSYLEVK